MLRRSATSSRNLCCVFVAVIIRVLLVPWIFGSTTRTACAQKYRSDFDFQEARFRQSVNKAMESVRSILDTTRNPRIAGDEEDDHHSYDDKFALAEFLTSTVIAAEMTALGQFGLPSTETRLFQTVWENVHDEKRSVTLRFEAEDSCKFVKEEEVTVTLHETETEETEISDTGKTWSEITKGKKTKISDKIKEFHWNVGLNVRLSLFFGNKHEKPIELQSHNSSMAVITSGGSAASPTGQTKDAKPSPPFPDRTIHKPIDINLTWLIQKISKDNIAHFSIDRFSEEAAKTCKTPRRNKDINDAMEFFSTTMQWSRDVYYFFLNRVYHLQSSSSTQRSDFQSQLDSIRKLAESLFHPILPLLENSTILSDLDLSSLLDEQSKRLEAAAKKLHNDFLAEGEEVRESLVTSLEANIAMVCTHISDLALQYFDSINYIEHMLEKQLEQAIGKKVSAQDFYDFMAFYYQKLFDPQYAPKIFSYAVRIPEHYPDGMVSVETRGDTGKHEPVETWARKLSSNTTHQSLFIPINAATSVEVKGDLFLHGWMQHRFSTATNPEERGFRLAAHAHQFSSFLLVVGTMAGATKFKPKSAIILQNKDEVLIQLMTEVLPSAKEFKDAIASLSPEQQEFAKAFRTMQLESSVFAVCAIQLKPQLEKLLGLPPNSLTKEIQLTQDLMSLFIDYQVPSDLLSVGDESLFNNKTVTAKVSSVKANVKAVKDVIEQAKEDQLEEEKRKREMRRNMYGPTAGPTPASSPEPTSGPTPASTTAPTAGGAGGSRSFSVRQNYGNRHLSEDLQFESFFSQSAMPDMGEAARARTAPPKKPRTTESAESFSGTKKQSKESSGGERPPYTEQAQQDLVGEDFTMIPKQLDSMIEKHDPEGSLRSTIVKADEFRWERTRQKNLLAPSEIEYLYQDKIEGEQKKAFSLLDALSRSGSLPIDSSELHVIVAVSHCFVSDIITTIIEENINPIEKVEKNALIVTSLIHGKPIEALVADEATLERVSKTFPDIMEISKEDGLPSKYKR